MSIIMALSRCRMGAIVSTIINSFGLILDIVGAVMIFVYGLPSKWQ